MNKIVREHYPVSSLPADLREGLADDATVRVVIEEDESLAARATLEAWAKTYWETKPEDRKPMTIDETLEQIRLLRLIDPVGRTIEEIVAHVRALRDDPDDE